MMSQRSGVVGWVLALVFAAIAAWNWQQAIKARHEADAERERAIQMQRQIHRITQINSDLAPPTAEPSSNP